MPSPSSPKHVTGGRAGTASLLSAQTRACVSVLRIVMPAVFQEKRPADRVLADFLRANRQYGGRDRRLLGGLVFAVFRWWGWLAPLAPPAAVAGGRQAAVDAAWLPLLVGAAVLDHGDLGAAGEYWGASLRPPVQVTHLRQIRELPARFQALLAALRLPPPKAMPALEELLPAWALAELPAEISHPQLALHIQARAPVWIRAQGPHAADLARELAAASLAAKPFAQGSGMGSAFSLGTAAGNLLEIAAFRAGLFEVQDLASQAVGLVCAPRPGERWWDACAGAGGKSLQLADLMANRGTIVASDVREYKFADLRKRARRAGFHNIRCRLWDGGRQPRHQFDGVLVDAPCSCSGTWRRNPDARWRVDAASLDELTALQQRLLRGAAPAVKPGGRLVYATCSMFSRENTAQVSWFLEAHPDFRLDPFPHPFTGAPGSGALAIWPWDGDCDAMFMARFRKTTSP